MLILLIYWIDLGKSLVHPGHLHFTSEMVRQLSQNSFLELSEDFPSATSTSVPSSLSACSPRKGTGMTAHLPSTFPDSVAPLAANGLTCSDLCVPGVPRNRSCHSCTESVEGKTIEY